MPTLDTHILVHDEDRYLAVRRAISARTDGDSSYVVSRSRNDAAADVGAIRKTFGGVPIGYVTNDETAALDAIAAGADEARSIDPADERALTEFLDRLALRARLRREAERLRESFAQAEKLTALGTLVAGIGHEINNPLSAISLSVEAARRIVLPMLDASWEIERFARDGAGIPAGDVKRLAGLVRAGRNDQQARRLLEDIASASRSIEEIVRDLRVFARTDHEEAPSIVDVSDVIDQSLRLVGREISGHGAIERDYSEGIPKLVVPRGRLTQVITNLLVNAAHALREVERPVHRVRITTRADDEFVAISVSDTGPGIAPESIERIFDPFFTTKRQEMGTGLGLSISRSILRRLGGDLMVDSVFGDGATFICLLPRPTHETLTAAHLRAALTPPRVASQAALSVMAVDDDERVLRAYARALGHRYRLVLARDGQEAVELLSSGSAADVLLTELDLPEMDGVTLVKWLDEHHPLLAKSTVVASAAPEQPSHRRFLSEHGIPVLTKPLRSESLIAAIESTPAARSKATPPPTAH